MLSHKDRKEQVHILTADPALAADVRDRIHDDPRLRDLALITPRNASGPAAVLEIERMAQDTVNSRLIIIDVRRATLPKLQKAYNQVAGFNRQDLNSLCYTLLIGDGPMMLLEPGRTIDVFVPYLAKFRLDYTPAAFFYDPFIHYSDAEIKHHDAAHEPTLLSHVPQRLAADLSGDDMQVADVRRYFRAASAPPAQRQQVKERRAAKLVELFRRRLTKTFGNDASWSAVFTKEGYSFAAEPLGLHFYPLYFEDWVAELMQRAAEAAARPRTPTRR